MSLPTSSSRNWRLDQLASDMTSSNNDLQLEWPHSDYLSAAQKCSSSQDDLAKLRALCDDLESLVAIGSGWASLERVARAKPETCACLRGLCWREVLVLTNLPDDVWKALYRLGSAYRAETMDSATRRTAMVLQLASRQRLKASAGFFECSEESERLERERVQLLSRPYVPEFLVKILA